MSFFANLIHFMLVLILINRSHRTSYKFVHAISPRNKSTNWKNCGRQSRERVLQTSIVPMPLMRLNFPQHCSTMKMGTIIKTS